MEFLSLNKKSYLCRLFGIILTFAFVLLFSQLKGVSKITFQTQESCADSVKTIIENLEVTKTSCGGIVSFILLSQNIDYQYDIKVLKEGGDTVLIQNISIGTINLGELNPGNYEVIVYHTQTNCKSGEYFFEVPNGSLRIEDLCSVQTPCGHPSQPPEVSILLVDENPLGMGAPYSLNILDEAGNVISLAIGGDYPKGTVGESLIIDYLSLEDFRPGRVFTLKILEVDGDSLCSFEEKFENKALNFSTLVTDQVKNLCANSNDSVEVPISLIVDNANCRFNFRFFTYFYKIYKANSDGSFPVNPIVEFTTRNRNNVLKLGETGKYKVSVNIPNYVCEVEDAFFEIKSSAVVSNIEVELFKTNPICKEDSGSSKAVVYGLQGPATYYWTKTSTGEIVGDAKTSIDGLEPGEEYEFHVVEEDICSNGNRYFVRIEAPNQPSGPILSFINSCLLKAEVDEGTPPYDYTWFWRPKEKDVFGFNTKIVHSEKDVLTSSYSNPQIGRYHVVVKDSNGCVAESEKLNVVPIEPRRYELCMRFTNEDTLLLDSTPTYLPPEWKCDISQSVMASLDFQLQDCYDKNIETFKQVGENYCHGSNNVKDETSASYNITQGHYTLYYYDRAGQLVRTVPPGGVDDAEAKRIPKNHTYVTSYRYNSLKQLIEQKVPDYEGKSKFKYNLKGQLRFSQNAQQKLDGKFSFTNYDKIGRIVEVGEMIGIFSDQDPGGNPNGIPSYFSKTVYTKQAKKVDYCGKPQRYLLNRVSYTFVVNESGEKSSTYFSYDPHGNVEWLIRDIPQIGMFTLAYDYDLITGNVKKVVFNEKRSDQFMHKYAYDEDNRITEVRTSKDGFIWERDAKYNYYPHGSLSRTEIGEDNIQGLDFLYTVQGWLKAINSPVVDPSKDLGKDGLNSVENNAFTSDVFAMVLGYHDGDFSRMGETSIFNSHQSNPYYVGNKQNLYNGNISSWQMDHVNEAQISDAPTARKFLYDKINRLKISSFSIFNDDWFEKPDYKSYYSYDANGNLKNLTRRGYGSTPEEYEMDELSYHYLTSSEGLPTNKLGYVEDAIIHVPKDPNNDSIDKYDDIRSQTSNNYEYDAIGNLIKDRDEEIEIKWNVLGKIAAIIPTKNSDEALQKPHIKFGYDETGNRIMKQVNNKPNFDFEGRWVDSISFPENVQTTYYVRDASGNVMGVYDRLNSNIVDTSNLGSYFEAVFTQKEMPVYGSERLGQFVPNNRVGRVFFYSKNFNKVQLGIPADKQKSGTHNVLVSGEENLIFKVDNKTNKYQKAVVLTPVFGLAKYKKVLGMGGHLTNNLAVAENKNGKLLLIGATAGYSSGETTTMLTDKTGRLLKGQSKIPDQLDALAKAIMVKQPGFQNQYYYFNRTKKGELAYAKINLNLEGYGKDKKPSGEITEAGILMPGLNIGRHMAAIEDGKNGLSCLYFTVLDTAEQGKRAIYHYILSDAGLEGEAKKLLTYTSEDTLGEGELKISPDKKYLFVFNLKEKAWIEWIAEITGYPIYTNYTLVTSSSYHKTYKDIGHTVEKGTFDFAENGKTLLYGTTQTGFAGQTGAIKAINLESSEAYQAVANFYNGDLAGLSNRKHQVFMATNQFNNGIAFDLKNNVLTNTKTIEPPDGIKLNGGLNSYPYKTGGTDQAVYHRIIGNKQYEIKDHLGNIRAVVSDVKVPVLVNDTIKALKANILSATDYYPFGMQIPGRSFSSGVYRYGFNGMEKDDELKGNGNSYATKFRQYDPRLGRWLSIDPLYSTFPWQSPYVAFDNSPLIKVDPRGDAAGDPEKLKKSAKEGAKASKDYKATNNATSACNIACRASVKEYAGKDLLSPSNVGDGSDGNSYKGQANDIAQALAKGKVEGFEEFKVNGDFQKLQDKANEGVLIIGVTDKSVQRKSGHVVMFVPGVMEQGASWKGGGKKPQVMDGGNKGDFESTPLTTVSGQGTVKAMRFYVYKPALNNSNKDEIITKVQKGGEIWKGQYQGERITTKNAYWGRKGIFGKLNLYRK